jgi:hypothetical protein
MPLSKEYVQLCRRIVQLRKHFLPSSFDPTGTYTASIHDHTRAFIALVHAEIEHFIEVRAANVAAVRIDEWTKNRVPNAVCFSLYAICYTGWTEIGGKPESLGKLTNNLQIEARLHDAGKQYKKVIDGNNGIKDENLRHLLIPLSFREKDFEEKWIEGMTNFGAARGQILHQAGHTAQLPDPKTTYELVWKTLVPGLKKLDKMLTSLES